MAELLHEGFPELADGQGTDDDSRRTQIYRQVLAAIRQGVLKPGQRLPSARSLASQWKVARAAVDDAFGQLRSEGLIDRRAGRGSFVVDRLPSGAAEPAVPSAPMVRPNSAPADDQGPWLLHPIMTDIASFPLATWRRLLSRTLREDDRAGLSYGPAAGLAALRAATAQYLRLTRAMDCEAGQVIIVDSTFHALELIAQVLLEPGDRMCLEDPGFAGVAPIFHRAQLELSFVPVDEQGFDVQAARAAAPGAAAFYLNPLNQYPTGYRTSAGRRQELLETANATGTWVIEGDFMAEIVHEGVAPPALWRSDRAERVLYVGTFGGVTFPAMRLAYLVVPARLATVFAAVRGMMGDHCAVAPQAALAEFIHAGHMGTHLRALRSLYGRRRAAFLASVARHLGPMASLGPTGAGIHACLHWSAEIHDGAVAAELATAGIRGRSLSDQCHGGPDAPTLNGLVIGYGASDETQIDDAMAQIGERLAAARARTAPQRPPRTSRMQAW